MARLLAGTVIGVLVFTGCEESAGSPATANSSAALVGTSAEVSRALAMMSPADRAVVGSELAALDAALATASDPERRMEARTATMRSVTTRLAIGRGDPPLRALAMLRAAILGSPDALADGTGARRAALARGERYTPTPADRAAADALRRARGE